MVRVVIDDRPVERYVTAIAIQYFQRFPFRPSCPTELRLLGVPLVRPPRCSPGFDPLGMAFATVCCFSERGSRYPSKSAMITSRRTTTSARRQAGRTGTGALAEAEKNLAAFDGVCDRLLNLIYGIGRSNRLANAAGPDHLNQLA